MGTGLCKGPYPIAVQKSAAEGVDISFWDYFRVGAPLIVITLTIGTLWLWVAIANSLMAVVGDVFGPAVAALTLVSIREKLARRMDRGSRRSTQRFFPVASSSRQHRRRHPLGLLIDAHLVCHFQTRLHGLV